MATRCLTIILTITGRMLLFLAGVQEVGKGLVYRRLADLGLTDF